MDDARFRYLERLLYDHPGQGAQIQQLEGQLEQMTPPNSCVSYVSPPRGTGERMSEPERYTILRNESDAGRRLQRELVMRRGIQRAVDDALANMLPEELAIYEWRYAKKATHSETASRAGCWSETERAPTSAYWRLRKAVVAKLDGYVRRWESR